MQKDAQDISAHNMNGEYSFIDWNCECLIALF